MTINDFITTYTHESCASHIITKYAPLESKLAAASQIARLSHHDENGAYKIDSITGYVLQKIALIDLYTDLERGEQPILETYDKLQALGVFDAIQRIVPESEIGEFYCLVSLASEDIEKNEYEIGGFVRSQVERFGTLVGTALKGLDIDKINEFVAQQLK